MVNDTLPGGGLGSGDIKPNALTGSDINEASLRGVDLWVSVSAEGGRNRSNGAKSVTHFPGSPDYTVDFGRDVSRCAYSATLGGGKAAFVPAGSVQATNSASDKRDVVVRTFSNGGAFEERAFFLVVNC